MKTAYIFAGGDISEPGFIDCGEIMRNGFVVCADRGYEYARQLGIVPDVLVGDLDSYTGELPADVKIYRCPAEKDDTDTMLAVKLAIEQGCREIILYGALGGRFDHAFANIQTLIYAHEHGCDMQIADSDNIIAVQGAGERRYPLMEKWYFSLFSLTEKTVIERLAGVKYPLENAELTSGFPIGVSNEISGREALVSVRSGLLLIVRSRK